MPARMKLNLFSPLPPVRSDIANFTCLVAAALLELADVTVWTAQDEPPELPLPIPLRQFDPAAMPWADLNQADLNIYNLGNNASFHRAIFDVARQAPGLIILHDTRLQHFFARYSETPGADCDFYLESMRRSHGLEGLADAQAFVAGELPLDVLVDRYPMTRAALDGALAAVIHHQAARDALAAQTTTPAFYLPLAYSGSGPARHRPPSGTLRLVVFGFIGFNRRLSSILEALAGLPDKDVTLDIYGALEEPGQVAEQTTALGLDDRVRQHGFVPEEALNAALAHADLALNLRYPSMGEASGSQLRIWDAALPSLVTRVGWYASLPADTVFFVEPDDEVAGIQAHLLALRRDPAPFQRAGLRGRQMLLEHHAPIAYAQGLIDIAQMAKPLHARRQAIALSHGATHALLELGHVQAVESGAGPVAAAVHALMPAG